MPSIAGINLLGVLLAAIAIYMLGFVWYGLLFSEASMNAGGLFLTGADGGQMSWLTADGVKSAPIKEGSDPAWMGLGFVISLVIAAGLGWFMKKTGTSSLTGALCNGFWLGLLIGVPLMAYGLVYTPWHSVPGFLIDSSHTLLSFMLGSAVLSFFD